MGRTPVYSENRRVSSESGAVPDAQPFTALLPKMSWIEGKAIAGTPESASGDWWMHHGINLELKGDYQAAMFHLDRER